MEDESHPDFALREYDYRSVYTTWDVSFKCVKQKNEDAAKMLQLWSCLDNKDIWYSLFNNEQNGNLKRWMNLPRWFERVMGKDVDFRKAVRILLAYSLIEAKEDSDAFAMHPVVHDWCRETLDASSCHEFVSLAITIIGYAVPNRSERNYWEVELRLLPHSSRCIAHLDHFVEESLQQDALLDLNEAVLELGMLCTDQWKFAEAEALFQWVLESHKKNFRGDIDRESDFTTRLHNSLGCHYLNQKKLDKAEAMFQRALTGFEESSGSDTKDTMMVINNLGIVYEQQGKLAEAEAMHKRALAWRTSKLGSDHVDTVDAGLNLGFIYQERGNFTEAESLLKRALAVQEDKLGPDHPMTLITIYDLGICYERQEKLVEAEICFERALSVREKILGPDHIRTLNACYTLGKSFSAQGRFVEAGVQFERALSGYKKNKDYEWTKSAAVELSRTYEKQGRLVEAEAIWQRLLTEFEAALGPEHVLTVDVCFKLGKLLAGEDNKAKLLEAEIMYRRALSGYKKNKNYEWIKNAAVELSRTYEKQGRLVEAEAIWRPLLAEFEAALGPEHELTLDASFEISGVLMEQGDETKLVDAEAMLQRALSGYKKVLGMDHERTLNTLYNLGLVLKDQGKLHEAEDMLQQALLGDEKIKGPGHQDTKSTATLLSEIYEKQGRRKEAKALYNQYHETTDSSRRFPCISIGWKARTHLS